MGLPVVARSPGSSFPPPASSSPPGGSASTEWRQRRPCSPSSASASPLPGGAGSDAERASARVRRGVARPRGHVNVATTGAAASGLALGFEPRIRRCDCLACGDRIAAARGGTCISPWSCLRWSVAALDETREVPGNRCWQREDPALSDPFPLSLGNDERGGECAAARVRVFGADRLHDSDVVVVVSQVRLADHTSGGSGLEGTAHCGRVSLERTQGRLFLIRPRREVVRDGERPCAGHVGIHATRMTAERIRCLPARRTPTR